LSAIETVLGFVMKPVAGMAMDLYGRKFFTVSAIFTVGIYTITIPWFKQIYPWFCIWKLVMYGFLTFVFEAPFIADYI
jgi:MFS family permease